MLVAVGLLLTATGILMSVEGGDGGGRPLLVPLLLCADFVCFAAVGAVVALARPDNRIGWMLLAGGALICLGTAGVDRALLGLVYAPGTVRAASAWAVGGAVLRVWGWSFATVGVPMVFPDGRLASRRWRWLAWLLGAAIVCPDARHGLRCPCAARRAGRLAEPALVAAAETRSPSPCPRSAWC